MASCGLLGGGCYSVALLEKRESLDKELGVFAIRYCQEGVCLGLVCWVSGVGHPQSLVMDIYISIT